ncbi:MAG: hypothetical protein QM820_27990 [Minicystis sp.]
MLRAHSRARLLVRTILRVYDLEEDRWSFRDANKEMFLHKGPGFHAASTTLIVPEVRQALYHATGMRYGFLYDAETAVIHKLNLTDANKNPDDSKTVIKDITQPMFQFVQGLKLKTSGDHNEVVASLKLSDLVGIVFCKLDTDNRSANAEKVEVMGLQRYLHEVHHIDLEIFEYDESSGKLVHWDPAVRGKLFWFKTKIKEPDCPAIQRRILQTHL